MSPLRNVRWTLQAPAQGRNLLFRQPKARASFLRILRLPFSPFLFVSPPAWLLVAQFLPHRREKAQNEPGLLQRKASL